jgi:hypothetical protein
MTPRACVCVHVNGPHAGAARRMWTADSLPRPVQVEPQW